VPSYSDPTAIPNVVASTPLNVATNKLTVGSAIVAISGLAAIGLAIFLYLQVQQVNNKATSTATEAATTQQKVNLQQSVVTDLNHYKTVASNLDLLFKDQVRWEQVMTTLQGDLYKHMGIESLQIDDKGVVSLAGYVNTYVDYAKVYAGLGIFANEKSAGVAMADPPGAKADDSGNVDAPKVVKFTITFTVPQTLLLPTAATSATPSVSQ